MPFPPSFTNAWDTTYPPDTQLANLLGQDLRNLRVDVMQRMSLLSGSLTNRPAPETVNATWGGAGFGLLYFATDTNQIFQWNGAAWTDVTAGISHSSLLNSQGSLAAITGNSTDLVFYTYTIPAGQVTNLQAIRVTVTWTHSTGAGTIGYNVSLNGVLSPGSGGFQITGGTQVSWIGTILNTGATTGTFSSVVCASNGTSPSYSTIAGLAWASSQVLSITFNTFVTDKITPQQFLVELIR